MYRKDSKFVTFLGYKWFLEPQTALEQIFKAVGYGFGYLFPQFKYKKHILNQVSFTAFTSMLRYQVPPEYHL